MEPLSVPQVSTIPWSSHFALRPSTTGHDGILPPRSHWTTRGLRVITWIQLLIPVICLTLDVISDQTTPPSVTWNTSNRFKNFTLNFAYDGASAAYWSNIIVIVVGLCGVAVYHHKLRLKTQTDNCLRRIHTFFSRIAAIFCAISILFEVWRWQVLSKAVIKHDDTTLKLPFALSMVACCLQVLPGTASLFVPVMAVFALTESKFYPLPELKRQCTENERKELSEEAKNVCINDSKEVVTEAAEILDRMGRKTKVSDVDVYDYAMIKTIIDEHMMQPDQCDSSRFL